MWIHDRLQELFTDDDFAGWFPVDGRRGVSPARLALASVLQYAENLTDRQAAPAVACRIDWKYCLGMELDEPGPDFSVLSEFRDRLAEDDRADRLLALMVDRLVEGWEKPLAFASSASSRTISGSAGGRPATTSTSGIHVAGSRDGVPTRQVHHRRPAPLAVDRPRHTASQHLA
ncbi:hypothetical protein HDA40_007907 [Hamadaea flava]|uniref:Transposase n=1 Tax=Hamadaea flava TaxID=1742688 RepID=A0ABV8LYF6_9ACTN|nr:transposase [Hamadaea flava]MCP2329400.1 hypothetical protein [Hamadaea flava]